MPRLSSRPFTGRIPLILGCCFAFMLATSARSILDTTRDVGSLSKTEIEEGIQECDLAIRLAAHKLATTPPSTSLTTKLFAVLFPSSKPAINALLATAYISGPPNFLLALCPPNIDPASLSIMVAFAVGGLLGDTLFHLLPEIFLGEDEHDKVTMVVLEPNRNLLLGVGILVGLVTFMAMDKALRIATGGAGHSHDHGHPDTHSHTSAQDTKSSNGKATGSLVTSNNELKKRKSTPNTSTTTTVITTTQNDPDSEPTTANANFAGLLNLIADFTHNITDGLALSTSFYTSPVLGASTTLAVFFHEIPHEVGDFALLIQSGFSKRKAMGAQFVTAVGAFLGTGIGIAVQEFSGSNINKSEPNSSGVVTTGGQSGIWGTSLTWGDMLLPFTAGTFLYVGTVAVIPELLEVTKGATGTQELVRTAKQFGAMAVGAGIMLAISWQ